MSGFTQKSFFSLFVFGSIFICAGAFIFLMSIDVIHVPDEDFNAPRWVVAVVGMVFALAGTMVMLNNLKSGFGHHVLFKWVYNFTLLIFMVLFAAPSHWIAFGSGDRSFNRSTSIGAVSVVSNDGKDVGGRLAFGIGAIIMDLIIVYILYRIVQGRDLSEG